MSNNDADRTNKTETTDMSAILEISKADEKTIAGAERRVENLTHTAKIAAAMTPDPREWNFEGDVSDAGSFGAASCTCGHPIRYVYTITRARDGASLPIGSTCIESTVPFLISHGAATLAADLTAAVARFEAAKLEAERKVRNAANADVVQALLADRAALLEWTKAHKATGGYLSAKLYTLSRSSAPAAASTPGRTAAALRTNLTGAYVEAFTTVKPATLPAAPKDRALFLKVDAALVEGWKTADFRAALADALFLDERRRELIRAEIALEKWLGPIEGDETAPVAAPVPVAGPAPKASGFTAPKSGAPIKPTVAPVELPDEMPW